jgi:2-keto-3-deoxy-L-rhamnonate aldolase RhmA
MEKFRQSVREGAVLIGAFIKTAAHQIPEILGVAGLDFAVIDAEHAPFDPETLDRMVLGGRAAGLPCLVRVPELAPAPIGQALDLGAAGVLVPHVASAEAAERTIAAAKYAAGRRGFSPSTRAGGYGAGNAGTYRLKADEESSVWCQIEDEAALAHLDAIAAINGVDCLFIGPADLAASLGAGSPRDAKVTDAIAAIAEAGRRHGRTVGIFVGGTEEIPALLKLGITVFVCGTDQSFILARARQIRKGLSEAVSAAKSG